jgi:hypothetical protein
VREQNLLNWGKNVSVKTFFIPSEASHISWCGTSFSVNILCDISICFISLVYVYYLIFFEG